MRIDRERIYGRRRFKKKEGDIPDMTISKFFFAST